MIVAPTSTSCQKGSIPLMMTTTEATAKMALEAFDAFLDAEAN